MAQLREHVSPDYYSLLEVDPSATSQVIRAAYRALARRDHPDHPSGSTARMARLNTAWAVLRDPVRRAAYDVQRSRREAGDQAPSARAESIRTDQIELGPIERRRQAREPASPMLDFGRYAGSTIADVANRDPNYVDWLAHAQIGRRYRDEFTRIRSRRRDTEPVRVPA